MSARGGASRFITTETPWKRTGASRSGQPATLRAFKYPATSSSRAASGVSSSMASLRSAGSMRGGRSPDEQMAAIANSDWASSHYGGGTHLHGTYNELEDIRVEKTPVA